MYSRDSPKWVCSKSPHDGITYTEGLHFHQKKCVLDNFKGLGNIKVGGTNYVAIVHHARQRFLKH